MSDSTATNRQWSLRTLLLVIAFGAIVAWFLTWALQPEVAQIPFDKAHWERAEPIERFRTVRSQMIDDVLRKHDFRGWTRSEVTDLLGQPHPGQHHGFPQWDVVYVLGMERQGAFSLDNEALGFKFDQHDRVVSFGLSVD